jgi:tetratricopeptide (TPR) repeat protein
MKTIISVTAFCCLLAISMSGCRNPDVVSASIYLYQQNDVEKAQRYLEAAFQTNPNVAEAHYMLGQVYARKKMFPEMLEEFNTSLSIKEKYKSKIDSTKKKLFLGLYNGAVEHFNNGRYPRAIENLQNAVLIDPADREGWSLLGKAYVRNDQLDDAVSAMEKAVALDTNYEALNDHVLLMQLYYEQKEIDKALATAMDILERDPTNSDAVKVAAFCYNEKGQTEKALEYYRGMIENEPDNPDLIFNLGLLYEEIQQYDKAVEQFEKVTELNPLDEEAMLQAAKVYLEFLEDYEKAVEKYQQALDLDPENPGIMNNLGIALIRLGEQKDDQSLIDKGTSYIRRAAELRGETP